MNNCSKKNNPNVLVIGDIMIDHYIYGECNRISPEAPVPVVEFTSESYTLGGAGNVVKNLNAFGCKAQIICVTGDDENTERIFKNLAIYGDNGYGVIKDNTRCTTIKTRLLAANHQLIRLDKEVNKAVNVNIENDVTKKISEIIKDFNIVLISDYNKGLLTEKLLEKIFSLCRSNNVKTIIDPKGANFSKYKGANIIKPNKKEAVAATGINITDEESLKAACTKIKELTDCDNVIVTMSEDGIAYFFEDDLKIIPTKAIDVVDVTGAGDTVLASLGLAIATGKNLHDACEFANHAAAIVVKKVGSATATLDEIERIYSKNHE